MSSDFTPIVDAFTKKAHLLIVDDDPNVLAATVDLFPSPLFDIVTASSAAEAEVAIRQPGRAWHCWILDIAMEEEESGLNLLRSHREFPFAIMLSGMHSMSIASRAMKEGAHRVFDKDPASLDLLHNEVCRTSALGFLLGGAASKYLPVYELLASCSPQSPEQWAEHANMTVRQLERVCQLHSTLTPRFQLSLFHVLYSLLLSDDRPEAVGSSRSHFEFVQRHLESTYIPWLTK